MGETNASRLRRETPTLREAATRLRVAPVDGSCYKSGNPLLQSLLGETNASRLRRETPSGCAT